VLALLAGGFGYEALQDRSAMVSIPVAASPVPAGSPIDVADTKLVRVHATDRTLTRDLFDASDLHEGWDAAVRLFPGEPITLSEVAKPSVGGALGAMSIEVPIEHAAGGSLSPGDLIDVIATDGDGGAFYVAQGIRVISVAPSPLGVGAFGATSENYFVVVAVDKRTALKISAALGDSSTGGGTGGLELVRSTREAATKDLAYKAPRAPYASGSAGQGG
jgi:Flp pilus assembly protein CpaB